jgi:prepilin-type N-terminal cleavage/methylation domain-containing protein
MNAREGGAQDGFTLVEMLAATAIVAIGLLAVAMAFQYAISGIEVGRGETMATFLAEAKLEELKSLALFDWEHVALRAGTTAEYCQPGHTGCSTVPTQAAYRRATTVTDSPGGTCTGTCKVVQVTVFYRPISAEGQLDQERRIDIFTMFVART